MTSTTTASSAERSSFTSEQLTPLMSLGIMSFCLGMSQFVIVGMLPSVAQALTGGNAGQASQLIATYTIGICVGLVLLPLARKMNAQWFITLLACFMLVGNLLTWILGLLGAPAFVPLLAARFIAGVPHGTFFGVASLIAAQLAPKGKEGAATAIVVTGQTVADVIGIPLGVYLASTIGWAPVFLIITVLNVLALLLGVFTIPAIPAMTGQAGKKGSLIAAMKRGPFWAYAVATFIGGLGFFTFYNFVSAWAQKDAGFSTGFAGGLKSTIWLMVVAGLGMFVGSVLAGKFVDRFSPARSLLIGLTWQAVALALLWLVAPHSPVVAYVLTFLITASLFYVSGTPGLMVANDLAARGLAGGVLFNLTLNAGNFVGTQVGNSLEKVSSSYLPFAGVGLAFTVVSVLLTVYLVVDEKREAPSVING